MKQRLILDTDIGTDVDDAFALLFALGCPDIELAAVTLVLAKLDMRAKIAFKILKLAGRLDVPVAAGCSRPVSRKFSPFWAGHEGSATDFSDIKRLKASRDGVDTILRLVRDNPGQVTIASVGPMTNIATAIRRDPETMGYVRRLVIMASVFKGFGARYASVEHNSRVDPEATAIVLHSGLPITLVGLNVTMQTIITAAQISALRGKSGLGDYVAQMADQYRGFTNSLGCTMHDPLAVAIAAQPEIAVTKPVRPNVILNHPQLGSVVEFYEPEAGKPTVDVCVDIGVAAFERLFFTCNHNVVEGMRG